MNLLLERSPGETDGRIPISLSSEAPVERYDFWKGERYVEVLDHGPEAVDLSYARDGLPFLLEHNTGAQIGVIQDVRVADGRIRGFVQMGNHPDASWVEQDIRAGIRKKVSVGYRTGEEYTTRKLANGMTERRYTRWMPLEGSSVSVPADYDVGVGRSLRRDLAAGSPEDGLCPECGFVLNESGECPTCGYPETGSEPAEDLPRSAREGKERRMAEKDNAPAPDVRAGANEAQERAARLASIARIAGREADLPKWLIEGRSVESVEREILKGMEEQAVRDAASTAAPGHVDLTEKEHRAFSLTRALAGAASGDWRGAEFEREVCATAAKGAGRDMGGNRICVPLNLQMRASVAGNVAGTSSLGGAGVQTTILSLIDLLRNKMLVRQLGATVLPGLTSNISFPRQITANTFSWTGENPSSAVTKSSLTLDNVTLSPKTGMSQSAYSRQILVQSTPEIDALVARDLMEVAALGIDLAALSGTGSSNQPTGVASQTGVIAVTMGANGAVPSFANILAYETQVATNNADFGNMAFVTSPGLRGVLKGTLKNTVAGSQYIWADDNTLNGYRAEVTNQVRTNLTKGTSTTVCHEIFFGNWSELLIGEWGGAVDLLVDPYSLAGQNMIQITSFVMTDVAVRHPKAFAYTADALIA